MFGRTSTPPSRTPDPQGGPAASARFSPKSASDTLKPSAPPPPPPPRVRKPRGGMLSMLSGVLTFAVAGAGAAVFGLLVLEREADRPGPLADDKVVMIPKGASTPEVSDLLTREGVIDSPQLFELYAYLTAAADSSRRASSCSRRMSTSRRRSTPSSRVKAILHSVTAPEGLTSEQVVQRLRDSDVLVGEINEVPREGTLLPDTYRVERGTARQQIISQMQSAQRQALAQAWAKRAPDLGIKTPQELIILASIVEKETGISSERPRVAGVFVNRLARRMKLQSDPTIVYGIVGGKGTLGRGITRAEIDRATPYNTYVIEGLPPGPIANPGRAALEAAANPAKTKELFFVAGRLRRARLRRDLRPTSEERGALARRRAGAAIVEPGRRRRGRPRRSAARARHPHRDELGSRAAARRLGLRAGRQRGERLRRLRGHPEGSAPEPDLGPELAEERPELRAAAHGRRAQARDAEPAPRPGARRGRRCGPEACRRACSASRDLRAESPRGPQPMTISSMTGFAREAGTTGAHQWAWELKSVNGRNLEIRVRAPGGFDQLGDEIRREIAGSLSRGQCQLNLTLSRAQVSPRVTVNRAALGALVEAVAAIPLPAAIAPATPTVCSPSGASWRWTRALAAPRPMRRSSASCAPPGTRLAAGLRAARLAEGAALAGIVAGQLAEIEALVAAAAASPARDPDAVRARLAAQVAALIGASGALDPARLHQEAALIAARADIQEEIDRLRAHVAGARGLLAAGGPVGRRLDFLAQEFAREANTLCAKAGDVALSRIGLDLKAVVDQFREQVANVE